MSQPTRDGKLSVTVGVGGGDGVGKSISVAVLEAEHVSRARLILWDVDLSGSVQVDGHWRHTGVWEETGRSYRQNVVGEGAELQAKYSGRRGGVTGKI